MGSRFTLTDLPPRLREQAQKQLGGRQVVDGKNVAPLRPSEGLKRRNKYNAQRVHCDGHVFASKHEHTQYLILKAREQAKEIEDLRVHVTFALFDPGGECTGEYWGRYTCDFTYKENGKRVVADAKSEATKARRDWPRTRQVLKACLGYDVVEL